jgi:hypothetical protein
MLTISFLGIGYLMFSYLDLIAFIKKNAAEVYKEVFRLDVSVCFKLIPSVP